MVDCEDCEDCEGVCNYHKITDIPLEGQEGGGRQILTRLAGKCKTDPR